VIHNFEQAFSSCFLEVLSFEILNPLTHPSSDSEVKSSSTSVTFRNIFDKKSLR